MNKKKKEGLCTKSLSFVGQSINQSIIRRQQQQQEEEERYCPTHI